MPQDTAQAHSVDPEGIKQDLDCFNDEELGCMDYIRNVERELRELLATGHEEAIIPFVKIRLLTLYRKGVKDGTYSAKLAVRGFLARM